MVISRLDMKTVDQFLKGLGDHVAELKSAHGVFVTYKTVSGYSDGKLNTGREDLKIEIFNGHCEVDPIRLARKLFWIML
jgi:hypothetical protein